MPWPDLSNKQTNKRKSWNKKALPLRTSGQEANRAEKKYEKRDIIIMWLHYIDIKHMRFLE